MLFFMSRISSRKGRKKAKLSDANSEDLVDPEGIELTEFDSQVSQVKHTIISFVDKKLVNRVNMPKNLLGKNQVSTTIV